jgi:CRP/FNR family transcriptional regulator, cyclic AMP receptor protein
MMRPAGKQGHVFKGRGLGLMARAKDIRLDRMEQVPLFASCSRKELETIGRASDEINVSSGTVLCEQGQPGDEFYLLLDGEATVRRDDAIVGPIVPGGSFGELALLTELPRNATVEATRDSTLLVLTKADFRALLDEVPGLAHSLLTSVAQRLYEADTKSLTH